MNSLIFKKPFLFLSLGFHIFTLPPAGGYVSIDVGAAHVRSSQIALQALVLKNGGGGPGARSAGARLFKTIESNLSSLGRFKLIDQNAFLEKPGETSLQPRLKDDHGFLWKNWDLLNTDYLIMGSYGFEKKPGGFEVQAEYFVYHVPLRKKIMHKQYKSSAELVRRLAHYISNDVVQAVTGQRGVFLTKITAVKKTSQTKKELFLMDWDGHGSQQISFHRSVVMSPVWHPNGKHIAYTAFLYQKKLKTRNPALLLYDRFKKSRRIILNRSGANLGFDFWPGGEWMLASLLLKGNRNIAQVSLKNSSVKPLTRFQDGSINVEPSLNPKRPSRLVFSSDRGGGVMIYSMDLKNQHIRRLTYQGSYNSTPDYSPDGQSIVFAGYDGGRFDIFIMKADGSQIRRLTSAKKASGAWANYESPSFAPDSRHIVFTGDQSGSYQLYIMNIMNHKIKKITHDPLGYKSPKWSPFLTSP